MDPNIFSNKDVFDFNCNVLRSVSEEDAPYLRVWSDGRLYVRKTNVFFKGYSDRGQTAECIQHIAQHTIARYNELLSHETLGLKITQLTNLEQTINAVIRYLTNPSRQEEFSQSNEKGSWLYILSANRSFSSTSTLQSFEALGQELHQKLDEYAVLKEFRLNLAGKKPVEQQYLREEWIKKVCSKEKRDVIKKYPSIRSQLSDILLTTIRYKEIQSQHDVDPSSYKHLTPLTHWLTSSSFSEHDMMMLETLLLTCGGNLINLTPREVWSTLRASSHQLAERLQNTLSKKMTENIENVVNEEDIGKTIQDLINLQKIVEEYQLHNVELPENDKQTHWNDVTNNYLNSCVMFSEYLRRHPQLTSNEQAVLYAPLSSIRFKGVQEALKHILPPPFKETAFKVLQFAHQYFSKEMHTHYPTDVRLMKKIKKYEGNELRLLRKIIPSMTPSLRSDDILSAGPLGTGTFNAVLLGFHKDLGTITDRYLKDPNPDTRDLAKKEYEAYKILDDINNLAKVHQFEETHGQFIMEKYDGSLESLQFLTESELLSIGSQTEQALRAMHERGVIHCDVKPENIFYNCTFNQTEEGSFKRDLTAFVGDLGLYTLKDQKAVKKGSPLYMSFNVWSQDGMTYQTGNRDLFALGLSLCKLAYPEKIEQYTQFLVQNQNALNKNKPGAAEAFKKAIDKLVRNLKDESPVDQYIKTLITDNWNS